MFLYGVGFVGVPTSAVGRECADSVAGSVLTGPGPAWSAQAPQGCSAHVVRRMRVCGPAHKCSRSKASHARAQARRLGALRICECSLLRAVIAGVHR